MVMAILSILLMVAIPHYQDQRTRIKVVGEIELATPIKRAVAEMFYIDGILPTDNAMAGLENKESYGGRWVKTIEVGDQPAEGSITVTYDGMALPALGSKNTIVIYPTVNNGIMSWDCDQGSMVDDYRPKECR